jgi:hypothetical protein
MDVTEQNVRFPWRTLYCIVYRTSKTVTFVQIACDTVQQRPNRAMVFRGQNKRLIYLPVQNLGTEDS